PCLVSAMFVCIVILIVFKPQQTFYLAKSVVGHIPPKIWQNHRTSATLCPVQFHGWQFHQTHEESECVPAIQLSQPQLLHSKPLLADLRICASHYVLAHGLDESIDNLAWKLLIRRSPPSLTSWEVLSKL